MAAATYGSTSSAGVGQANALAQPAYDGAEAQYPQLSLVAQQAAMRQLRAAAVCKGHWSSRVRRILELTNPLRESPAESASFGHFVEGGLPVPEVQVTFAADGRLLRSDFYWQEFGLVGECDGSVKYDGSFGPTESVLVGQNVREQALRSLGLAVVRWTASEAFYSPSVMLERVATRLLALGWIPPHQH